MESRFILAYKDKLFTITYGCVLEHDDFVSIGSGECEAIGSLLSTKYFSSIKQSSLAESGAKSTNSSFPVNLNTCTAQELTAIDGIGDTRASAIIQYREYLGGYTSVEQIKEIKGIGDALYEKISPYLTV